MKMWVRANYGGKIGYNIDWLTQQTIILTLNKLCLMLVLEFV